MHVTQGKFSTFMHVLTGHAVPDPGPPELSRSSRAFCSGAPGTCTLLIDAKEYYSNAGCLVSKRRQEYEGRRS